VAPDLRAARPQQAIGEVVDSFAAIRTACGGRVAGANFAPRLAVAPRGGLCVIFLPPVAWACVPCPRAFLGTRPRLLPRPTQHVERSPPRSRGVSSMTSRIEQTSSTTDIGPPVPADQGTFRRGFFNEAPQRSLSPQTFQADAAVRPSRLQLDLVRGCQLVAASLTAQR
jgi:hypothetical protein